ncbi:energy transducer TonB [Luteimonas deserti]|uniref:Energy transducer TonB n=1 Tax=Luteimonas deserti TaxID=2752306 RepID=A0A7Z0U0I6_9GAMM|nr:energy transducer TonB [Luteimonas deserti]NYZ63323.1 energy transducer TonB [Luteimonas deserti]
MPALVSRLQRTARALAPGPRAWWLIAGAGVTGVLLCLLLLSGRRAAAPEDSMQPLARTSAGEGAPLPTPLPAADMEANGIAFPPAPPAPPPRSPAPAPAPRSAPPLTDAATPAAAGADARAPRPVSTPAPDYPRAALRRGESGEVLLRVHVGVDGRTRGVDVVRSSGSARLDRAAVAAVRRWRFEPAMRNGSAVEGEVQVPVEFAPAGPSGAP